MAEVQAPRKSLTESIGGMGMSALQKAKDAANFVAEGAASLREEAFKKAKEKVASEYGEDMVELLDQLATIVKKVSGELNITKMKYGLMLAFPLIHLEHDLRPLPAAIGQLEEDADLAAQIKHWSHFALAAYGAKPPEVAKDAEPTEKVQKRLELLLEDTDAKVVMAALPGAESQTPGHFICVDPKRRAVVLGIRGTVNLCDAITDSVGNSIAFPEYPGQETHQAILVSARTVLERTKESLTAALAKNPGFGVVITGHSLGAGTAILCALLLKASPLPGRPRLRCFVYAPPPVLLNPADPAVASLDINAVVHRHDIIPRVCLHSVYVLGREAIAVDSLDLGLMDRLQLIRKGKALPTEENEKKQKVVASIAQAKQAANSEDHPELKAHHIPGRVFWINSDVSPAHASKSDCGEFQALLLRAGIAALEDHRMPKYRHCLEHLPPPTVTFPEIREVPKEQEPRRCCGLFGGSGYKVSSQSE
mmetsp:Transcript_97517/g.173663  ORF Transcript_97517/g.173663 Transcript_97517/m.173663 type:complete len:479 (-) Transcript_97517:37-1473(-)